MCQKPTTGKVYFLVFLEKLDFEERVPFQKDWRGTTRSMEVGEGGGLSVKRTGWVGWEGGWVARRPYYNKFFENFELGARSPYSQHRRFIGSLVNSITISFLGLIPSFSKLFRSINNVYRKNAIIHIECKIHENDFPSTNAPERFFLCRFSIMFVVTSNVSLH